MAKLKKDAPVRTRDNAFTAWMLSWFTDPVDTGIHKRPIVGRHEVLGGTTPGTAEELSDWRSIL